MPLITIRSLLVMMLLSSFVSISWADLPGFESQQRLQLATQDSISYLATDHPLRPQTEAPPEKLPVGEVATDHGPFTSDGWKADSVCGKDGCTNCVHVDELRNCSDCGSGSRRIIADVELLALRTHFSDQPFGKLAEHYELSERIVLGMEKANGIGGRIRYWTYDRTTPNLQGGTSLGADFSVTDFEGTTHFGWQAWDITFAGGLRFADIRLDIDTGHTRSNQMPGATFAVDLRGLICGDSNCASAWHSVGGVRWSVLGGDWRDDGGPIAETHDDNVTVLEIYGGFEYSKCCHGHEVYARLVFEAQNWRSDALGENTGIDSMGFVGPGLNMGVNY